MTERDRYLRLIGSFHTLRGAPGVNENHWEIDLFALDAWAAGDKIFTATCGPFPGDGAKAAAQFVLNLWDNQRAWRAGKFDLFRALVAWDDEQRRAWQAWAANPWRP